MGKPFHVIIIGAGPAGLSAALSLLRTDGNDVDKDDTERAVRVTLLELRKELQTLGGAVNLTPLALRYLDSLGVGERLRPLGTGVGAIEIVAHRTGGLLGRLWPDVDAIRVQRQLLVESMMETLKTLPQQQQQQLEVVFGARIQNIEETGLAEDGKGSIRVTYKDGGGGSGGGPSDLRALEGDVLLGCDGLHSQVRTRLVEPARQKTYSGKCVAYGYTRSAVTAEEKARWVRADGSPLVADTALVSKGNDSLLMSYYEPSHSSLYLAAVTALKDKSPPSSSLSSSSSGGSSSSGEGWAVHGADKAGLKRDVARAYADGGGGLDACLGEMIDKCDEWFFFPVYTLPPGGVWARGRALLLGDAAHGMPPQGESTGAAIEDGVLVAHVLSRRTTRSIPQLFRDYEALRRADIDAVYRDTMARWSVPVPPGWMAGLVMEWLTWAYVKLVNCRGDYFARDVRKLALPD